MLWWAGGGDRDRALGCEASPKGWARDDHGYQQAAERPKSPAPYRLMIAAECCGENASGDTRPSLKHNATQTNSNTAINKDNGRDTLRSERRAPYARIQLNEYLLRVGFISMTGFLFNSSVNIHHSYYVRDEQTNAPFFAFVFKLYLIRFLYATRLIELFYESFACFQKYGFIMNLSECIFNKFIR